MTEWITGRITEQGLTSVNGRIPYLLNYSYTYLLLDLLVLPPVCREQRERRGSCNLSGRDLAK